MDLRSQVLRGGMYLAARQTASIGIGLAGVILLTRLIGPANYGLAAGAVGIVAVMGRVGSFGIDAFLIRREGKQRTEVYHQAFSLLLVIGLALVAAGYLLSPLLALWLGDRRFVSPLLAILPVLPLFLIAIPATAQLERELNYRALATWDLAGHLGYYAVALPLAALDRGVWAPVAGYWTTQGVLLVRSYVLTGYRPRWYWSRPLLGEMLHYGVGFSASSWIWQLRALVN
ncbi:MAG: oligosaccharide flippase family protein, partial [Chloroflexota bacterium]|nr:oligosaccharide flippase family protein [Chloroflexota bacterium]